MPRTTPEERRLSSPLVWAKSIGLRTAVNMPQDLHTVTWDTVLKWSVEDYWWNRPHGKWVATVLRKVA